MKKLLLSGAALTAVVAPVMPFNSVLMAQETTASVRGTVESNGAVVPGATIIVEHTPSGTTATTSTDANGNFSLPGLRVGGPFTITVEAVGYENASVTEVYLSAGQPLRLPVNLLPQEAIVVTGQAVTGLTVSSTGPYTALNREDIEGASSVNRDIRDLARRDPFATMDLSNSRTIEIAGTNGRLNRFSVDGVQFSDDFGLNNGGLPTSRGPVPFDAIEQFSVKVAPFDIAEGDFQGGAVDVVLRSGTNALHGSAFYTYTDDSLVGSKSGNTSVELGFDSKQYGGTLSGPIIKDKLFFMVAYEKTEESDPFDNGVGAGYSNQVPGVTQANIDQVSSIAQSVYGYDTLGQIQNAVEEDEKIVVKLDANLSDDHRASLTYIRNVGNQQFQQNTFLTPPAALGLFSNGYELKEEVNSGVFQLNSNWSDEFSTELRVSYRDYNRDQTPFGGRDIAQFEVCLDPTSVGSATSCNGSRIFFGPDVSRHSNDLNTDNLSVDLTARIYQGDHSIKLMAGFTDQSIFNLFLQRSLGDIYFDSIADFQAQNANRLRLAGAVPSLDANDAAANFTMQNWSFGIQDDWQVTDSLIVNMGARYDLVNAPGNPPANNNFFARHGFYNTEALSGKGAFQPRVGFSYTASDRLVVRGGIGIFAGGTPDVFLSNSYSNTGQLSNAIDINDANCGASGTCAGLTGVTGRNFPQSVLTFLTTNVGSLAAAPVNAIDPDLELASQMRASLSVDYDADLGPLGDGWLFGVNLLYGKTVNGYQWTDLRSVPIGTLPDGRTRYGPINGTATTNQDLLMTNSHKGRSYIGVVRIEKSFGDLRIGGSYTRSDIKDVNAVTSSTAGSLYSNNAFFDSNEAAYGRSAYEIKDQWKFDIDFSKNFFGDNKTRISIFGEYRSGRPYSITMLDRSSGRSAVFGTVGNGGRQLLYVPTVGDTKVVFDTAASEASFNTLISNLGLEGARGTVLGKNSQTSPDVFKVDLKLSQELPLFVGGAKVELFADVENVLNMIDKDWGELAQVGFPYTAAIVTVECSALAGTNCTQYRYSRVTDPAVNLVTRPSLYQIRVGAKIRF